MKRTFLMTGLAVLTLAFFMTGCNSMKKLQKEVIETAVVGYVNPCLLYTSPSPRDCS